MNQNKVKPFIKNFSNSGLADRGVSVQREYMGQMSGYFSVCRGEIPERHSPFRKNCPDNMRETSAKLEQPVVWPTVQMTDQPTEQPAAHMTVQSAEQPAAQMTAYPAEQPAAQVTAYPAERPTAQMAAYPAEQLAMQMVAYPTVQMQQEPYFALGNLYTMGSYNPVSPIPYYGSQPFTVLGNAQEWHSFVPGENQEQQMERPEVLSDSTDQHGSPDKVKKSRKKSPGKKAQRGTDENCHRFSERMFSYIFQDVIRVCEDKASYEENMDSFYGFKKDGYLYLRPRDTFNFVEAKTEDEQKPAPIMLEIERYLDSKRILDTTQGAIKNFRKKITVKGKRSHYWCMKIEKIALVFPDVWKEENELCGDTDQ